MATKKWNERKTAMIEDIVENMNRASVNRAPVTIEDVSDVEASDYITDSIDAFFGTSPTHSHRV